MISLPLQRDSREVRYLYRMVNKCALLFAIALFGYPVVGSVISLLQIDSRVLSVPFRVLVALSSVWIMLISRHAKMDVLRQLMILIWFLYILRLLHDWLVANLQGADYALQFFVGTAVLPAFALMKAQAFQHRRFALISFMVATGGALLGLLGAMFGSADVQDAGTAGRLSLAALNPVTLGNQSTSAILCGVVLWRDARFRYRIVLAATFTFLLFCLIKTGSRGPAVQLLVCVGLWALRRGYVMRLGIFALPLLAWFALSSGNPLADRLAESGEDTSSLDRLVLLTDSLKQIEDSPLIGSAFVELNSGFYPHNVFVEAGLAFGVPVALVFAGIILVGAYRSWKTLKTDYDLLGLLYLQGLLDAAVAGSLYAATPMWVVLALLPRATRQARKVPDNLRSEDLAPSAAG